MGYEGRERGWKVNEEFEKDVLDQMVFTTLERVNSEQKATFIANVCYSHSHILVAAEKVKMLSKFTEDDKVQKPKFRRTWNHRWLRRSALRKVASPTAQRKQAPSPENVRNRISKIQAKITFGVYASEEVFNGHESIWNAVWYSSTDTVSSS